MKETSGIHFCSSNDPFSLVNYYTLTLISLQTLKLVKLLKITRRVLSCIRESFVMEAMLVSHRAKSQKFKMMYFQNEKPYRAGNL